MRVVFLVPYPINIAPSQRFRFEQYFSTLEHAGITYKTQSFWDIKGWNILYKSGQPVAKTLAFIRGVLRRVYILFTLRQTDFVFIHRECMPIGPPLIEWIVTKILRKNIIYDFDDAIWLPNTSLENRVVAFLKWHSKVSSICSWSKQVSCGNAFLAEFAKQFNRHVVIIPTTIDTEELHNHQLKKAYQSNRQVLTIGWTGSHSTLKYLTDIQPVLKTIINTYGTRVQFTVIADKAPLLSIPFNFIKWNRDTEIEDLAKFDIGIMPLRNDIWSKGKCGFKALQYMAMEIPAVISPVGVNTRIVQDGINGMIADADEEWITRLAELIDNSSLRKSLGHAGRNTVINLYSVESQKQNYLDLFR